MTVDTGGTEVQRSLARTAAQTFTPGNPAELLGPGQKSCGEPAAGVKAFRSTYFLCFAASGSEWMSGNTQQLLVTARKQLTNPRLEGFTFASSFRIILGSKMRTREKMKMKMR